MDTFSPSPHDIEKLKDLGKALADLDPGVRVDEDDAILTVQFDTSSTVDVNAYGGDFSFGTTFLFEDGGGTSDTFESIPTNGVSKAAELVRATLLDMPRLKAEAVAEQIEE